MAHACYPPAPAAERAERLARRSRRRGARRLGAAQQRMRGLSAQRLLCTLFISFLCAVL